MISTTSSTTDALRGDVMVRRYDAYTGTRVTLVATGVTLEHATSQRGHLEAA